MAAREIRKVAVVFDDTLRPETSGVYCRKALAELVEVEHFRPDDLDGIDKAAHDLFLRIDDGLHYDLPERLRPSAWWAIDTHLDFEKRLQAALKYDFVFAAQKNGAERLRERGVECVRWLPLACDPQIHGKRTVAKRTDLCFVGNVFPGPREDLLDLLRRIFPDMLVDRRYFEEMAETYSASKIVFNCSVADDVNMRVFEALASGSLLLANDLAGNGQAELFEDGVHLATYRDAEELLDKARFYLKHDEIRERIAAAGYEEAIDKHTYLRRMREILAVASGEQSRLIEPAACLPGRPPVEPQASAKVSACLLSWKRPDNVRKIVAELRKHPFIDDIVIWNNNPTVQLEVDDDRVKVFSSDRNLVTYGRYLAVERARHPVVYVQDDDCVVHNVEQLYRSFQETEGGIAHGLKLGHLIRNGDNKYGGAHMALVGWGAFLRKEWTAVLRKYVDVHGEDELLYRKADRIFSILLDRPHRSLLADVTDLPGAEGSEALSVRPDHLSLTEQAVARALAVLGRPANNGNGKRRVERPRQDAVYFQFDRPELLERVPRTAERILEIGCAAGRLGASVKTRQDAHVVGVETDPIAADFARQVLDEVVVGDIENPEVALDPESFDCVICGDVLEHLRDPLSALRRIRAWLKPEGSLIASIPNVRHHSVIRSLLAGNWTYEPAGLLDQTHMRFFAACVSGALAGPLVAELGCLSLCAKVPGVGRAVCLGACTLGNLGVLTCFWAYICPDLLDDKGQKCINEYNQCLDKTPKCKDYERIRPRKAP